MKRRAFFIGSRIFAVLAIPAVFMFCFGSSKLVWEFVEYFGASIVTIGVVGEYIKEFKEWPKDPEKRKKFAERSVILLIFGLVIELLGLVKTTQISGREIAELENASPGKLPVTS